MTTHSLYVSYNNGDDSLWLACVCGWAEGVGSFPTPETLLNAAVAHRACPSMPHPSYVVVEYEG